MRKIIDIGLSLVAILLVLFNIYIFLVYPHIFINNSKAPEQSNREPPKRTAYIDIGDNRMAVEVVTKQVDMAQGLSGRKSMPRNQGMLFVFNQPGNYYFWMKGMNFPLDILWIDQNFQVVDITKEISINDFPVNFSSRVPAQYVLEVNAGWTQEHGVGLGTTVDIRDALN